MINSEQSICPICGGELVAVSEEVLKCRHCASTFRDQSLQRKLKSIQEFLDQAKIDYVNTQRRNLYDAVTAKYISRNDVHQYATEIKKYLPDDFQANFYLEVISGDVKRINQYIREIDVEENYELLAPVIQFLIASLESEYLLEANLLIERAYKNRDLKLYSQFSTKLSEEADKVEAGIYETFMPRDVFIGYSSKDMKIVSKLCEELEAEGITCFVAARNLRHGVGAVENYDLALREAMDNCACFLFVSSENSRSFSCDALRKEIPYIQSMDIQNTPPNLRTKYSRIPYQYKKPRIEYRLDMKKSKSDRLTSDFFDGLEWTYDTETVLNRLEQILYGSEVCDHHEVIEPAVEPTCTTEGRTEGSHCSVCGETLKQSTVIPAKGHHFGSLKMTKAPTCTEDGKYERVCDCGEKETILVPSLGGHKPGEWETVKAATHEADGLRVKKCIVCGEQIAKETVPAEGHHFGNWTVTQKQTCTREGIQERVCSCGKKETVTFPSFGGHRPGAWETVNEPSPGKEGTKVKKCVICGEKLEEAKIPALPTVQAKPPIQPTYVPPACNHVEVIDPAVEATCTKPGRTAGAHCSVCGEILRQSVPVPAKGHSFGSWKITKQATCTESGVQERVCVCGEKETKTIPSLGGHKSGDWEIVKEPAPGKEGMKVKKCTVCGKQTEEQTIPALPEIKASHGLAYKVNDDGKTCSVTGQGTCKDKDIVIPEAIDGYRVTAIVGGEYKSGFNKDITSITIPNSVTTIGEYTFYRCTSLTAIKVSLENPLYCSIDGNLYTKDRKTLIQYAIGKKDNYFQIPNSVTSIGEYTFYHCESLTSVTIPNSVTSIVACAFQECKSLTSVTIPNSVKSIGFGAFEGCTSLSDFRYDGTKEEWDRINLGPYWKNVSAIRDIQFGASATPAPLQVTPAPTQKASQGLAYKVNDDGKTCTVTGQGTCKDKDIVISETINGYRVTSIGNSAFWYCTRLASITIPNSVTSIGNWAFKECTRLASITIPNSVTSIGEQAFYRCTSLTAIKVSLENPLYCSVDGNLYTKDRKTLIQYAIGKKDNYFQIPNSVTSIGNWAFRDCKSLTSVTIPNSVTSIGVYAFYRCTSLTSVVIGNSVTSIGIWAFEDCTRLTSVTIPNSVTSIGRKAFNGCASLTAIKVSLENPLYCSVDGNLYTKDRKTLIQYAIGKKDNYFQIPNSVTCIGNCAFEGCTRLASVSIPNSVTCIGNCAFVDCTRLASITIPNSVTSIGGFAFKACTSLKSVTIPNSVTTIGEYTFYRCTSLKSVTIPNSVTSIGNWAFKACTSLKSVTIPNSVTSIREKAFKNCSNLVDFRYAGTKREWEKISLGENWRDGSAIRSVTCTDGVIQGLFLH